MDILNDIEIVDTNIEKDDGSWMEDYVITRPAEDVSNVDFGDTRLNKRLFSVVEAISDNPTGTILSSYNGGRADAKAAYRLLSNEKFDIDLVKAEYYSSTIERVKAFGNYELILALQDTTEVDYNKHKKTIDLGYCNAFCLGIRLHTCIAVTESGIPLGVLYQDSNTRKEKKDDTPIGEKVSAPIEEKESYRWIEVLDKVNAIMPEEVNILYVADREADFYEYFAFAQQNTIRILTRMKHDRVITDEDESLIKVKALAETFEIAGTVMVHVPRDTKKNRKAREAVVDISYGSVQISKPITRTEEHLPDSIQINVIHIKESNPPEGVDAIEWYLVTLDDIRNEEDAILYLNYYVKRWLIERFYYVLKSGCNVEKLQERTFNRLSVALFLYSMVAIHLMVLTYFGRVYPELPCDMLMDEFEWKVLQSISRVPITEEPPSIQEAVMLIARLGGFAGAPSDGYPGAKVIWRGYGKLQFAVDVIPLTWNVSNQLTDAYSSHDIKKKQKKE